MKFHIDGIWRSLSWGCAFAGRPSIQIVMKDRSGQFDETPGRNTISFYGLIQLLDSSVKKLKLVQIHSVNFRPDGSIKSVGDPLTQEGIFPLVTHLLENIENRVILHVNNCTDISMLDPRANIVLIPFPPSSGKEKLNYWSNIEYLSDDGEILFSVNAEEDYQWMVSLLDRWHLPDRLTVHMAVHCSQKERQMWAKRLIRDNLGVHLLPETPFTPVPLKLDHSSRQPKT